MEKWRPTKKWWGAYGALHGNGEFKLEPSKPPRKKPSHKEQTEQIKFNFWFEREMEKNDCRWFHPPNGGRRNLIEGSILKRSGVKAGVPDCVCPMARKGHHGLVIEFKTKGKKPNELQRGWLDWFARQNWSVHVAYSFEEAKAIVLEYFSM